MDFTPLPKVTDVRLSQSSNDLFPMCVTPSPTVTEVISLPHGALSPKAVSAMAPLPPIVSTVSSSRQVQSPVTPLTG